MRLTFTLVMCLVLLGAAQGQTTLFTESFENNTLPDSVTYTGNGVHGKSSSLFSQGLRSDSMRMVVSGDSVVMTTQSFSTLGNSFVMLYFDQICKIEYNDEGYIEVSNDNGASWVRLTGTQYQGASQFGTQGNKFSSMTYQDWVPTTVATPSNAWWKAETFDISLLVGNAANVKIRFVLRDAIPGFTIGDNYAWFIDNIRVLGAFSELNPPVITMVAPIPQDTMYTTDPYLIKATITDFSGIDTAYIAYTVNTGIIDTVGMVETTPGNFEGSIPFFGFGRTIHYKVIAIDASSAHNVAYNPGSGTRMIFAKYSAGGTVTIGTGTSSSYQFGPVYISNTTYLWSNHISLFTPAEIGYTGALSAISWYKNDVFGYTTNDATFRIYLKHTNASTVPSTAGTFASELNGAALVYESTTQNLPPTIGWTDFVLTNPNAFSYNGTSNLMVMVYWYRPNPATGLLTWQYTTATGKACTWSSAADPPTAVYGNGSRPNIKMTFVTPSNLTDDAGIGQIVYPTGGVIANNTFNVVARIKNYGIDTLTQASVHWTLDGVLQTPYSWTGSLLQDSLSTDITIGALSLPLGVHDIKIWTVNPNGVGDMNFANDTMMISFMACANLLAGTYTIGGTGADFADFSSAMIALDQCGINAPVTFNVASGTYTEQVVVPYISGASATNPVVFQSATGDSTAVTLTYNAAGAGANYLMKFDSTQYVTIKNIKFQPVSTTFANAIVLTRGARYNTIRGNYFVGKPGTTNDLALIRSENSQNTDNLVTGNRFEDGSIAIWAKGASTGSPLSRFHITGNVIEGFTSAGVKAEYVNAMLIDGNTIHSSVTNTGQKDGIHLNFSVDTVKVTRNKIVLSGSTNTSGLQIQNCTAASGLEGLIANNFISILNGITQTYGMRIIATTGQKVYHNSVFVSGTSNTGTRGINTVSTSSNIYVLNNNVECNYYPTLYEGASCARSNYNNLYSSTNLYGYYTTSYVNFNNLNDLKAATQKDTNSVAQKPYFNSSSDLHTFNGILNGLATPVPEVTHDIDGQLRNALTPDPGADEFDPPAIDIALLEILAPGGGCRMDSTETVVIMLKNTGTNNITSGLTANFRFNNSSTVVSEPITTPVNSGDTLIYTFNATVNMNVYALGTADTFALQAWTTLVGDFVPYNDSLNVEIESKFTPLAPVTTSPVLAVYGQPMTLTATSPWFIQWYAHDTSTVALDTGAVFTTPPLFDTTTYWVDASSGASTSAGSFFMTEVCHYKYTPGVPVGGWPAYLLADDYIEITGVPGSDLAGITLEQWNTTALLSSYTFPAGTILSPNGTAVIAVGQMGSSVPVPSSFYYHGNGAYTGTFGSTIVAGRILKDAQGNIIDAVGYGAYSFPAAAGVTPADWSGNTPALSSSGNKLIGPYTKDATNWVNSGTVPQDPNILNTGVVLPTPLGCPSVRIPVVVNTTSPPPVDAGISAIIYPQGGVPSGVAHQIVVELKNFGTSTLNQVNIYYRLNGALQDSLAWTGALPQNSTASIVLDTIILAGGVYCIDSWTKMPNNIPDTVNANDTSTVCFNACMAGTYSIGPAATGTYHFNTFNSALNTLISSGICGHVVFEVHPGIYTEQLTVPEVIGMDDNNTVTFRGATNDSTLAILQYSAASAADNWTLRLNGADYFRFERLTINALSPSFGRVIELIGGATGNRFAHNKLVSAGASTSTTGCIYDGTSLNHYNTYLNNYMSGGYYTMYIYGASTASWQKGTVIQGNEIVGSYYYPMNVYYQDSVQIIGNKVHSGVAPYSYGISAYYINNRYRIVGNSVNIVGTSATACYGIRDAYGNYVSYNANPTGYGLVANNMISIQGGTGVNYGLYSYYCNGTETYYNSVLITGGSATGRALHQASTSTNTLGQIYKNNIFANTGGGYAAYFTTPAQVSATDYNNYYTSASTLAYWSADVATLAALQTASGKEVHSRNINPPFNSNTDLHLSNTGLSGKGTPVSAIQVDFDGEPRSLIPTIGADEIPLLPIDAGVIAITSPGTLTNEGQQYPVTVTLANFGTDTIFTMTVQYTINNGAPVSAVFNDTLLSTATTTFSLPMMTSPAGNATICAKTLLLNDSNTFNDEFCTTFFATPLNDARVIRIVGLEDGCNIGLDTISIWVKNQGVNAINSPTPSTVSARYRINPTAPVVTETFTPVLLPGDSVLFHFATLADFSVTVLDDTFSVVSWIDLAGDNVSYNDSAFFKVISLHVPQPPVVTNYTIPYGTSVTLFAQSADSVLWFAQDTASVELHAGAHYTTPMLYTNTTYWAQAGTGFIAQSGTYVPGINIAPQALVSASNCSTGPCSAFNDLNMGVCGTQLVWVSTSNPPSLTPHVNYIDFEWTTPQNIDGMKIHHAQTTLRILTGATLYKWDAGAWVSFHTFSNLPIVCENVVQFPMVTTTKLRITSFQMNGPGQTSNPNFREIEVFEANAAGCNSIRVPVTVTVSGQAPCDVGVIRIIQPTSATNLGAQETVRVTIRNFGTQPQSNIPVSFRIDNLPVVTETVTGPISPNDSLDYIFVAKANLGVSGVTYQLKAWTGLACDITPQNDTMWKSVTNLLPVYCASSATSALYQEISNVTVSTMNHTSPVTGAMYTNHSMAVLPTMLSPGVTYPMSITSSFATGSSTQQNCWVKVWVDMDRDGVFNDPAEMVFSSATTSSNTVTANVQIPFTAMTGNTMMRVSLQQTTTASTVTPCNSYTYGETEDYMVTIAPQAACDAGVIGFINPGATGQSGIPQPVYVKFMNFGSNPIAAGSLSVAYTLNGGTPVTVLYPGGLAPGAIDSIVMPSVTFPMGNNALCATTILACDSTIFNNEICKGVYGEYYATLPYFDDFEASNLWYKPLSSSNWQYGTPSANIINSAYSGNKAWVTNLTGDYTNNADDYLYTPVFNFGSFGSTDTITLSFYHWLAMAASDYGQVQYNLNGGAGWANLGFFGDPAGTNWYNTQVAGVHYFSLTNTNWQYSAYKLSPSTFNGVDTVQFRFRLYSNASVTSNGWALDNFRLALPTVPNDVGATAINFPVNDTAAGSSVNVQVTITNFGTNTQTLIPVALKLNGNLISTETWTGVLTPQGTSIYTFVLPFTVPATAYQLCAETQLTGDAFPVNNSTCASFTPLPAYHDAGISQILAPQVNTANDICFFDPATHPWYHYDVIVRLENYGQNVQTTIPIQYTFYTGGPVFNDSWSGSLQPGTYVDITLDDQFMPKLGAQQVCVETALIGDGISANNKQCKTYNGITCIGIDDLSGSVFLVDQNIPNPAAGTTTIGYTLPQSGDIIFGVMSTLGQVIHSEVKASNAGFNQLDLDVSELAAGVYYYFMEYNGQRITKKLIVRR